MSGRALIFTVLWVVNKFATHKVSKESVGSKFNSKPQMCGKWIYRTVVTIENGLFSVLQVIELIHEIKRSFNLIREA